MKSSTNGAAEYFFADTNLLLYTLDPRDPDKYRNADRWVKALWESGAGRLSWQVLHEYYASAIRKLKHPPTQARLDVEGFLEWRPVGFDFVLFQRAWHWTDRAQTPFWDSLIVASAEAAGCAYLLSEDFQDGQKYDTVTIVNPFRHQPDELLR